MSHNLDTALVYFVWTAVISFWLGVLGRILTALSK